MRTNVHTVVVAAVAFAAGLGAGALLFRGSGDGTPASGGAEDRGAGAEAVDAGLAARPPDPILPAANVVPAQDPAPVAQESPPADPAAVRRAALLARIYASGGRVGVRKPAKAGRPGDVAWLDSAEADAAGRPVVVASVPAAGAQAWLADLAALPDLSVLRLFGDGEEADLENLPRLAKLERVVFDGARATPRALAPLARQPRVARVDVHDSSLDVDAARVLGSLERVTSLTLDSANVTDATLAALAAMPHLERLNLDDAHVTDAGLVHLAGLSALSDLDLTGTRVTGEGFRHLAGLAALARVTLDKTRVDDAGLRHVAALPALRFLDLEATELTDDGLAHLAQSRTLVELILEGTKVTDAGLDVLSRIPALERLGILNTAVTADGVARLKASRPGLKVEN